MKAFLIFSLLCFGLLLEACAVNDAKESKQRFLHVYLDKLTHQDSLLFKKFYKEEHIRVRVHCVDADSLFRLMKSNPYASSVDLIILSDYEQMKRFSSAKMLLPIHSERLKANIDPIYRSRKDKWFALSKSALVLAYNKKVLNRDTIRTYFDLTRPLWKGKLVLQEKTNPSMLAFARNVRLMMKGEADSFLYRFYNQRGLAFQKSDWEVLEVLRRRESQLGLVKLSSLAAYHHPKDKRFNRNHLDVSLIFPNQKKRGCYFTITVGAVNRYAKNALRAQQLLEFLSSARAQYLFAEGRLEYPVLKGVDSHYLLRDYGKIRGRFYKEKFKSK